MSSLIWKRLLANSFIYFYHKHSLLGGVYNYPGKKAELSMRSVSVYSQSLQYSIYSLTAWSQQKRNLLNNTCTLSYWKVIFNPLLSAHLAWLSPVFHLWTKCRCNVKLTLCPFYFKSCLIYSYSVMKLTVWSELLLFLL